MSGVLYIARKNGAVAKLIDQDEQNVGRWSGNAIGTHGLPRFIVVAPPFAYDIATVVPPKYPKWRVVLDPIPFRRPVDFVVQSSVELPGIQPVQEIINIGVLH